MENSFDSPPGHRIVGSETQFSLSIHDPHWKDVFTIPRGTVLQKGRHGIYPELVKAAGAVDLRFGCYSWGAVNLVHYCGSFAQDNKRGNFNSNLHARVHHYWQTHNQKKKTGHKNTNLMVFENIGSVLRTDSVHLRVFSFSQMQFGEKNLTLSDFSQEPDIVHAVEQILIATYRKRGECSWNRS